MENLDALDKEDLHSYAATFRLLAKYADTMAAARANRISGNIALALCQEKDCVKVYAELPEWARW